LYRNHYGDHDIGYESVVSPGTVDSFRWVRLNGIEALAFARLLPEVRALVYAVQVLRSWLHDETQVKLETPGPAESRNGANFFVDLDHALAPFQESDDDG
jgi:hypothetical protein